MAMRSVTLPSADSNWAVVLGASSGTGAAIATQLARGPGLNIFGAHRGRYLEQSQQVVRRVLDAERRCEMWQGDAAAPDQISLATDRIAEVCGKAKVSFFVHSIANASFGSFVSCGQDQLHPKQIEKSMQAMAHSFVYWAQALLSKGLLAPGACLLGLTNPMNESIVNGLGLITATKAALEAYIRHLALELGPLGFRANLLKFGLVETPAIRMAFSAEAWGRLRERVSAATPCQKLCTVEEVARFVSVLASPGAEWFNGATIDFTGGQAQSAQNLVYNPSGEKAQVKYERKATV